MSKQPRQHRPTQDPARRRAWAWAAAGCLLTAAGAGAARADDGSADPAVSGSEAQRDEATESRTGAEAEDAWAQLDALLADQPAVTSYRAEFTQQKFSPLLMDPIESRGQVRVAGDVARWDTESPHASTMLIQGGELKLYYPESSTLEVYDLGQRLESMAASPVLETAMLREYFELSSASRDEAAGRLELVLLPRQEQLAESLEQVVVSVALDAASAQAESDGAPDGDGGDAQAQADALPADGQAAGPGALRRLEMTDLDGETTVLEFRAIRLNPSLDAASLELEVPAGTAIVRPTEGAE